jgi:hypothetical protein
MKKILSVIGLTFLVVNQAIAQRLVLDPALLAATIAGDVAQNNRLDEMKENQTAIERAQKLAVTELVFINDWQKKMYEGLTEVAGVLKDLRQIKEAAVIVGDIVDYQKKVANYAKEAPHLVLFAEKSEGEFVQKASGLVLYISTVALQGGKDMLMDAGERAKLINHIVTELRLIRALAWSAQKQMYWAKMDKFWRLLNPWQSYVNQDKRIMADIMNSIKF